MKYIYYFTALLALLLIAFFIYKNYFENKINNIGNNTKNMEKEIDENSIKKEYKIVAFGDSLTAGYGVDLKDSYPSILEENLNKKAEGKNTEIKIINMGVSGETTSGGVDRVEFVISQNPNLVLLGLGANDMLRSTAPSLTRDNLDKIIKSFKDKNIKVILLGMESQITNGIEYRKEFNSIYPDLSGKYDLPLVPFFLKGVVLVPSLNTADSIHPNRMGYEKIIKENVEPVLLPYLKKIKII
jgi:acyl-CoA thioesterase-1